MSKPTIYIDGKEGTTGLQIYDRLAAREDLNLVLIDEARRKDPAERARLMNGADIVFLCLPDAAAVEAVELVTNPATRIIDCSTAHRTAPDWAYGFPELSAAHRERIRGAGRVANPGCHATGFISIVYPLVSAGLLSPDAALGCFSLTGYSGGGKKMIARYEGEKDAALCSPRIYGLHQDHKHLPEMQKICGLSTPPVFSPIVDDYYKGMATTVPLFLDREKLAQSLTEHYQGRGVVRVFDAWEETMLAAHTLAGSDSLFLIVEGNRERSTVTALFDNLGKGASGAAVQNMNLMLGLPEETGLNLS